MSGSKEPVPSPANNAPVIVGIYGIPGSGKTLLLHQLERELWREHFAFYEVPGGLGQFREMTEQDKLSWRQHAIDSIRGECLANGKTGIVTGHFMVWPEGEDAGRPVYTQSDLDAFTHILYLNVGAELIVQRRRDDPEITHPPTSVDHLRKWQEAEQTQLRRLCLDRGILFCLLSAQPTLLDKASTLLRDFGHHTEAYNLSCVEIKLDEVHGANEKLQTMLVFNADKTLAPEDTDELFWAIRSQSAHNIHPPKSPTGGPLGSSYWSSRQAVLLYEEFAEEEEFDALCALVASAVHIHPEFLSLLRLVAEQDHVGVTVVTCGLRAVWEKVLEAEGLSKTVKVIGGGRIADGLVMTAAAKACVVSRLKDVHHLHVVAFGDSPLDLRMMSAADQAIVVVGEEANRSETMDELLYEAMLNDGLRPSQVLLPSHASRRLPDVAELPVIQINNLEFAASILSRHRELPTNQSVLHATDRNAAKLLMPLTRDGNINSPTLREAYRHVGWFLAVEFLAELVGLEEHATRLRDEHLMTIVALLPSVELVGGGLVASGVLDALPAARIMGAKTPIDVPTLALDGRHTVILVDSVVNSGRSIVQFVRHIRAICSGIRIVVIAAVVREQSVTEGDLAHMLAHDGSLYLIALHLSK
ncbi:hypothetical protein F5Y10DRAFT_279191 [Nemania abortiva]|nr:hypothetical protein F5Y10DRAFT_279191 [Nemania abortiva]